MVRISHELDGFSPVAKFWVSHGYAVKPWNAPSYIMLYLQLNMG